MVRSLLLSVHLLAVSCPIGAFVPKGPNPAIRSDAETHQDKTKLHYRNEPSEPMELPHNPLLTAELPRDSQIEPDGGVHEPSKCLSGIENKSKHDIAWNQRYHDLRRFHASHGHSDVPYNYPPDPNLAIWVTYQRRARKRGKLASDRIAALDGLGFRWESRTPWRRRFAELAEYRRRHGHARVPSNYEENPALGRWLNNQRQQYRALCLGLGTPMTDKRMAALVSLGVFDEEDRREAAWSGKYQELLQYRSVRGHADVPRSDGKLGRWVDTQRRAFQLKRKGKASPMTDDRIAMLDRIGFNWEPAEKVFNERLEELEAYQLEHGNCNVPDTSEFRHLRAWMRAQRGQYALWREGKKSTLTAERVEALERLGIEWDRVSGGSGGSEGRRRSRMPWEKRFGQLRRFKSKHGHLSVPRRSDLGEWVKAQKRQRKLMKRGGKSSMTVERFNKLASLGLFEREERAEEAETNVCQGRNGAQSPGDTIETAYFAPFIEVTMSDEEKLAAWRERFKQFRR